MNARNILSKSLLGVKSPKPTVDNEVNEKYTSNITICYLSKASIS